ncbi:MAG: PepSY-associated TM helix domain-containing protein [Pseudomonadota bacterium]
MTRMDNFRASMNWVHTWAGVVIGALLFAMFWMGSLSVFDKEIDRWMQPESRLVLHDQTIDYDKAIFNLVSGAGDEKLLSLSISPPSDRVPFITAYAYYEGSGYKQLRLNADTGDRIPEPQSLAGSGFIFPFHFMLHIPAGLGYWLVGFAALAMMTLLVTGIIIHRKIFVDFFTFRPKKKIRRSSLDLHNVTSVLFLPFYFLISFSGLVIFAGWYASLPWGIANDLTGDNTEQLYWAADEYGYLERSAAGEPGADLVSIAPLIAEAEAIWTQRYNQPAKMDRLQVANIGDANSYISVFRTFPGRRVEMGRDAVFFDGATGELIKDFEASPIVVARKWIEGFHFVQFRHWPLRWLYFVAGLTGCIMIATGFVFWTASRRKKEGETQPIKVRVVEAITIGSVTGIIISTGVFLIANRLIPVGETVLGQTPEMLEVTAFYLAWIATFLHASLRTNTAWLEQSCVIAILAPIAVALNWLTTGDHIFATLSEGKLSIFGMDLVLIAGGGVALMAAMRLTENNKRAADTARQMRTTVQKVPAE